jgi:hypothetical protein
MDYEVDLCSTHSVIRLTVMAETVTQEMATGTSSKVETKIETT